ncbi:MAG TPA: class I SAM-dependent methyltransferase [Candidatus Polarisedimenticolaceae bacterium]|nr:class I SAM-dependent methyltransferase [Candidatus Polarisedimenticolaceae bacterium]
MADNGTNKKRRRGPGERTVPHRHLLYSAAVQSPETDLDFFERVYRRARGTTFRVLREDFCGTAAMACEWVKRRADNRAIGIDLDPATLAWGKRHYVPVLGRAAERLELIQGDVRDVTRPPADVIAAQNFSYSVFKTRAELGGYFRRVRRSLNDGGLFFVDAFGGTDTLGADVESRRVESTLSFDGRKVPSFTYVWEQASFNPVDHHIVCYIHFKLRGGERRNKAFRYDWRLWTLPELRELMLDAGFATAEVWIEGWDDEADDTDGVFRRRKRFENMSGWIAYVVGSS